MKLLVQILLAAAVLSHAVSAETEPAIQQMLRQGQRRELFSWGDLLNAVVCHGPLPPPPHCKGHGRSGSGGGGGGGGSSSSSGGSSASGKSGNSGGESGQQKSAEYNYEDEQEAETEDDSETEVSSNRSDPNSGAGYETVTSAAFNPFMYVIGGLAVATVVGVFLVKRKERNENEDDEVDHELSQGVAKRLKKLLAGEEVTQLDSGAKSPSFVPPGESLLPPNPAPKPEKKVLPEVPEPDLEAIEMQLNGASSDYVKM